MKTKSIAAKLIVTLLAIVMLMTTGLLAACGGSGQTIRISGSSSVAPVMQKLAAAYESKNKEFSVRVNTSDSTIGVTDTLNGNCDIGMVSRDLKPTESGITVKKLCMDGVAIIVNKAQTVENVTNSQIYDLYASGASIGSITIAIAREEGSGTRDAFDGLIKNDENKPLKELNAFHSAVEVQNSTGLVMTDVASNSSKLGYISMGSLNDTVKTLNFNSVAPTTENVKNGTYKLSRPFNLIVKNGTSNIAAQKFLDFCLSADGQKVLENNGYISVI